MKRCVLCGGEIPSGWPAVALPTGLAHRFRTMCDPLDGAEGDACHFLEAHGQRLGFDFEWQQALARAGALVLESRNRAA